MGAPGPVAGQNGLPADAFQQAAAPDRHVILFGTAFRLGYRAPPPSLVEIAGQRAIELDRDTTETVITAAPDSLPIFRTDWHITYGVGAAPQGALPYPPNPALRTAGGNGTRVLATAPGGLR